MSSPLRGAFAVAKIAALAAALTSAPALAEGSVENGAKVFKKCAACHAVVPGGPSKAGPNLHDVVGRATGTLAGFKFSPAMAKLGKEGHIWTPEELEKFVDSPKTVVPGTKMTFAGLKKPEDRADVVAYLISLNPAATKGLPGAEPVADSGAPAPSN